MVTKINKNIANCLVGCAICAATATTVSCSDFLEIKPQSEIILEDFWSEKADVDNIVAGCYSRMQHDDVVRRFIVWGECRADNVAAGQNIVDDGNLENVVKENITTKNAYTNWDGLYSVINRCNTVIKYAPGVAASDPGYTDGELKATIAEVSGLRDLCYFYLIRTFRNVPYSTQAFTDDDQKMDLPPTSFEVVLDSLINDLEVQQDNAMLRYPETSPKYQTGRITKCAIWAMLCEMYLWKGDYNNCIKYADLVIEDKKNYLIEQRGKGKTSGSILSSGADNSRFNGFPLVSNQSSGSYFGSAFYDIFVSGNSQETIFELMYDNSEAGHTMLANSAVGALYGNSTVAKGLLAPSSTVIEDGAKTSQRTVYADRNKLVDARIYQNCNTNTEGICKFVYNTVQVDASSTSSPKATYGTAYSYNSRDKVHYNSSNWIIYRLADIMLLKAEALTQLMREGSDQEIIDYNQPLLAQAFSLVNAVNKRSVCEATLVDTLRARDYNTKSLMQDLVMQERQRELMFEGKRWYDLVRISMRDGNTDVLCEAVARREGINTSYVQNFFASKTTGMYAIFWPYNDEEIKVNLNLASVQNPAFSSGEGNISK